VSHLSQNITPTAIGMIVRDEEEGSVSPLPMVSERNSPSSIILPLSKQEIKLPFLNQKKDKHFALKMAPSNPL
jgi:hypothetical protein